VTTLDSHPLPQTARHDEKGDHIPPHIPEWRRAAGSDRVVRGSEVERNQRQKAAFAAHLAEHRRRGEPAVVVEEG
jgi:hypothetical protein